MIYKYGEPDFKYAWLDLISHDPVHPSISVEKRITGSRTVFVYVEEDVPQFLVCARIGKYLPHTLSEVLSDDMVDVNTRNLYAVFYSIFRLPNSTMKGGGAIAIKEIIEYCKAKKVNRFYTLSPIPFLSNYFSTIPNEQDIRIYLESKTGPVEKFHLGNGATVSTINYLADVNTIRMEESWGIMVNYNYGTFSMSDL